MLSELVSVTVRLPDFHHSLAIPANLVRCYPLVYQSPSSKFTDTCMLPTTTTIALRWLTGSKMIFVTFHYRGWSNENMETKWYRDTIQKWNAILDIEFLNVVILNL